MNAHGIHVALYEKKKTRWNISGSPSFTGVGNLKSA